MVNGLGGRWLGYDEIGKYRGGLSNLRGVNMEWGLIFLLGLLWWLWCNAVYDKRYSPPRKLDRFFWGS
jgi:hypothetical protein